MSSSCSISSTLMDMESTASSGRSTPAMLNGHSGGAVVGSTSAPAGGKSLSYTCCWDQCQLQFPSSPDLAEHIRATHVDAQRGGVSVSLSAHCMCVSHVFGNAGVRKCNLIPPQNAEFSKKRSCWKQTHCYSFCVCVCACVCLDCVSMSLICVSPHRCLCAYGKAARFTTHHPPVRAGCRDTC